MSKSTVQWIIKDTNGEVTGPFSTVEILDMISSSRLSGEEQIALFPGREWRRITNEPQFYDRLLDILSEQQKKLDEDSVPISEYVAVTDNINDEKTPVAPEAPPPQEAPPRAEPKRTQIKTKKKKAKLQDIELVDMQAKIKSEISRRGAWPILVLLLVVLLVMFFMRGSKNEDERMHLLAPRANQPSLSTNEVKEKTRQAVSAYLNDTLNSYLSAQNQLVQIVEGDPKNHEVMALLCLTYYELWPYSYRDEKDLNAVKTATQLAVKVDPGGLNYSTCKAVELFLAAKIDQAKGVIESVIDAQAQKNEPAIALYYLKAVALDATQEYASSINYLQSAQRLWPQWTRVYVMEAEQQIKVENYSQALRILTEVLTTHPAHPVARAELGILEFRQFKHNDKAEALLREVISSPKEVPSPLLSSAYLALAELQLQKRENKQALKFAEQAYALSPGNASAKNLVVQLGGIEKLKQADVKVSQLIYEGDQLVREGDCYAAQAHFKAAFQKDPQNTQAAFKTAQCLWKVNFTTEAIEWLNKAIRADPKFIGAYVLLADFYTQRYNFVAAAKTLATAQRVAPRSHEVYRGLAMVELKRGNAPSAINFAKKAIELYQADLESYVLLAEAYAEMRDSRQALAAAARAIEIDGNFPAAHVAYAKALIGLQGQEVAVSYLSDRVKMFPVTMEYRLSLGEMLLADDRAHEAASVYRDILAINNKEKEAMLGLGKALRKLNQYADAQDVLLRAAVLDPADPEPLYTTGLIYLELNKPDEAIVQFDRVLKVNAVYPLVNYYKGRAYLLKKDGKMALAMAHEEVSINPNMANSFLLAAEAYSQMGQFTLCAGEYQKAIKLRPQGPDIYLKMAQCYRQSGNLEIALTMLKTAESKDSGLPEIYREQGIVYETKGDFIKAIEAYNQYFVLDPNAPDRGQIEGRINSLKNR